MDFAVSQKNGLEYHASLLSYDKAKSLDMICPVCFGKVFKRVRWIPEENHCFVHYKGGSFDCELYHANFGGLTGEAVRAISHGQDFKLFIKQVSSDIDNLLIRAKIYDIVDEDYLNRWSIKNLKIKIFGESFDYIEELAVYHLGENGLIDNKKISRIMDAKLGFYRHPQARFIDSIIVSRLIYAIHARYPQADIEKLVDVITINNDHLEAAAGLMFAGLSAMDARSALSWFYYDFDVFLSKLAKRIPKSILKQRYAVEKKDERIKAPKIIKDTLAQKNPADKLRKTNGPWPKRYSAKRDDLIKIGYKFEPAYGYEIAIAPNGKRRSVHTAFDLDDLLIAENYEVTVTHSEIAPVVELPPPVRVGVDFKGYYRYLISRRQLIDHGFEFLPYGIHEIAVFPDGNRKVISSISEMEDILNSVCAKP